MKKMSLNLVRIALAGLVLLAATVFVPGLLENQLLALAVFLAVNAAFFWRLGDQRTILFDIHGVLIDGDFEVEDLHEVPGTRDVINKLKQNYRVAGFTNMSPEMFALYTVKWQFSRVFDKVFHSGELGMRKPEAKAFREVLRRLNAQPKNVIFIDDRAENVEAARNVGIQGIQFKSPSQLKAALRQLNVRVN